MTTAIETLATFVANTDFAPDTTTVTSARDALIDTLGCILTGAREDVGKNTVTALSDWGTGSAPVIGTTKTLPVPWAALANGSASHILEFDDWEIPGNTHPSGVLFAAILAQAATRPTSGKAILEAYIAGFEVIARVGEAVNYVHYANGWHSTATLGALGAAAAVARLRRLSAEQTAHAIAISVSQAVGYATQFGSNTKPLQAGFAAKAGVVCASLAAQGLTGQWHALESDNGFNALMAHADPERFAANFRTPGTPLALTEYGLVIKPYPSCGYTHRLIDCALQLRDRVLPQLDDIVQMTASLPNFHGAILPFQQPQDRPEAVFSLPFCIALALVKGHVTLQDFEDEAWTEPQIMRLIQTVEKQMRVPKNPDVNYDPAEPDWIEITLRDGTVLRSEVAYPLGAAPNNMSSAQILEKFESNLAFCQGDIDGFEAAIAALKTWETADDINAVIAPFCVEARR